MKAVVDIESGELIGYLDVLEPGDRWDKTVGCDACPLENRLRCCGNCPMLLRDKGECRIHDPKIGNKPIYCVLMPAPMSCQKTCALEFRCVVGSAMGKLRRVRDIRNELIEEVG